MEEIFELKSLLPKLNDFNKFLPAENEINYILNFVSNCLNQNNNEKRKESLYLVESLSDKMWERINTGPFSEVPADIRKVYAVANYFKIIFLLLDSIEESQIEKCNEIYDKTLLIGSTENLYNENTEFLNKLSKFLNQKLGKPNINIPNIEEFKYDENALCDIPKLDCPSLSNFQENHFNVQKPVLLKNTIKHWPALQKWKNLNYLLDIAGNRTVPIEIGSNYTTDDWSQELMKLKDFLKRQFSQESPETIEYLAQHELFDQIPELKNDIRIPDYCCLTNNRDIDIKAWLGPKNTISPLHQDPKNNILCQIFGQKKIILASCDDTEFIYSHPTEFLNNTSEIDAENIDFIKFPLAKKIKFYHLILQEGDCVFIPKKWWHHVKSLNKSFSVSFWWD